MQQFFNFGPSELIALAQVIVAFIALIVAPEIVRNAAGRFRSKVTADCTPYGVKQGEYPTKWLVRITNKSPRFDDISVSIFPESQGNRVISYKIRTRHDGGLAFDDGLNGGHVTISFTRYCQYRHILMSVSFAFPDFPTFTCKPVRISRRLPKLDELRTLVGMDILIIRDRLSAIMLLMIGLTFLLCARIAYVALLYL